MTTTSESLEAEFEEYLPNRLADEASMAVNAFNHNSKVRKEGWEDPGDAYDAVGSLVHMARMLPQAIEQATRPVSWTHLRGRLRMAENQDPDAALAELDVARMAAESAARHLTSALQRVQNAMVHMGAVIEDAAEPTECNRCGDAFDPADTKMHGAKRRYPASRFCCACVDGCHDNERADHRCVVCS
ncbi:hypothetical protein [Streptomyces laurentii]|uniref:hypothetical protein n=1 Tax=Streptomyces laurentii TaxID=39478 RepID=UPI0036901E35